MKEKNKLDRIEASIKLREEDVRVKKQEIDRERQLERGVHLHEKAVQNFRALLADMVGVGLVCLHVLRCFSVYLGIFHREFARAHATKTT